MRPQCLTQGNAFLHGEIKNRHNYLTKVVNARLSTTSSRSGDQINRPLLSAAAAAVTQRKLPLNRCTQMLHAEVRRALDWFDETENYVNRLNTDGRMERFPKTERFLLVCTLVHPSSTNRFRLKTPPRSYLHRLHLASQHPLDFIRVILHQVVSVQLHDLNDGLDILQFLRANKNRSGFRGTPEAKAGSAVSWETSGSTLGFQDYNAGVQCISSKQTFSIFDKYVHTHCLSRHYQTE